MTASEELALLSIDGPIATITLNRPAVFNAINLAIAQRLESLGRQIEQDDAIRVLVIEGAGRSFCAGGDLQTFLANADTIGDTVREMLTHYHRFIASLRRMPKMVVTSVHGAAAGAGLSLAFMGDACIAADDAKFTAAYNKLGVSPDGGGTVGFAPVAGAQRALQVFLSGDPVSAAQMLQWGLIAEVVPAAELKAATARMAQKLARNAPAAIATTKALVYRNAPPVEAQLDAEMEGIIACMQTKPFRQALAGIAAKSKG